MERYTFTSAALGGPTNYLAFLPQLSAGERVPLLVLLHGANGSPEDFVEHMRAALDQAAQTLRIAVVAPDGGAGGWWLDSPKHHASRYASLVAVDLLAEVRAQLPVNETFGIMGLSMGGHGALTLALDHPGLFRSVSSVSGVVDLTRAADRPALVDVLGPRAADRAAWEARSALHLFERAKERAAGFSLRLSCGVKDHWLDANRKLHARLTALGVAHAYDESRGGHEWKYWSRVVPAHVVWHAQILNPEHAARQRDSVEGQLHPSRALRRFSAMGTVNLRDPEQWLPRDLFAAYCGPDSDALLAYYDKAKAKRQLVTFNFDWLAFFFLPAWLGYRRQWALWATLTGMLAAISLLEALAHIHIPYGAFGGTLLALGSMAHGLLLTNANGLYLKLKRQGLAVDAIGSAMAGKASRHAGLAWAALLGSIAIGSALGYLLAP